MENTYTMVFGISNALASVYQVKADNLEQAFAKLGADCNDYSIYSPIEWLSQDELDEMEMMSDLFMYVDSTEYGGGCGYFNVVYFSYEVESVEDQNWEKIPVFFQKIFFGRIPSENAVAFFGDMCYSSIIK